jgi:hypothetical protein
MRNGRPPLRAVPSLSGKRRRAAPAQGDEFRLQVVPRCAGNLRKDGVDRNAAQNGPGEAHLGAQFLGAQFAAAGIPVVLNDQSDFIRPGTQLDQIQLSWRPCVGHHSQS